MKRNHAIGLFITAVVIASFPLTSRALVDDIAKTDDVTPVVTEQTETVTKDIQYLVQAKSDDIRLKREEIQTRVAEQRSNVQEKLSSQRKDACLKKEVKINQLINTRATKAERILATFDSIYARLTTFVAQNQLSIKNDAPMKLILSDAQDTATAAVAEAKVIDFSCNDTSTSSPGKVITGLFADEKQALKDYRDALKDYSVAVKEAAKTAESSQQESGE